MKTNVCKLIEGSDASFVNEDVVEELGFEGRKWSSMLQMVRGLISRQLSRAPGNTHRLAINKTSTLCTQDTYTYWVDSMNVEYWIQGQSRENKWFIANCVGEIHEFSAHSQWLYVPLNVNPTDFGTESVTVEELASADLW